MRSSSDSISIAANTRKIDVDNRISLRNYYRIANNLLKQADIYREEKNVIDLYIMLLRFSSLITETIPCHREYNKSPPADKLFFKKKLYNTLTELELVKPAVQSKLEELNRKSRNQVNGFGFAYHHDNSLERSSATKWNGLKFEGRQLQAPRSFKQESYDAFYKDTQIHRNTYVQPDLIGGQHRKSSLVVPRAKEETLSRHSILGPTGLSGQWKPVTVNIKVEYPSSLDLMPIEIPWMNDLQQKKQEPLAPEDAPSLAPEKPVTDSKASFEDELLSLCVEESTPVISANAAEILVKSEIVRQPSPPPVLADVLDVAAPASLPVDSAIGKTNLLEDELLRSKTPIQVHISTQMMGNFMRLAKSNTERNLETCGVLAGSLKNKNFYITALIIPKQESTANTCQTTNEEEIFDYQDKQSLFPLGWIHTHPTQSCFMSSVDVHTHYSYQIMLPEAIAIVMAPTDSKRTHGIFRLTSPGGMSVIRKCQHRGFHAHDPPEDGGPIYHHCSDVYMNPNLKFDVVDFR